MSALLPAARATTHGELDVTDPDAVADAVAGMDHVVHLAAMTNVDGCETEEARARAVNIGGTANVVHAAERARARVILLSTDYVFDGRSRHPYAEDATRNPLNVYGRTKADAEDIVLAGTGSLVIRSSWIFGDGRNFVRTILEAARAGGPLRVVEDQLGLPTPAEAVAAAIGHAIDHRVEGLLHVTGDGPIVSWADLARAALDRSGRTDPVEGVTTAEYATLSGRKLAARPAFSALDITKAKRIGVPLLDWREGLDHYIERAS